MKLTFSAAVLVLTLTQCPAQERVELELEVANPLILPGHGVWALYRLPPGGGAMAVEMEVLLAVDCATLPCTLRLTAPGAPKPPIWIKGRVKGPGDEGAGPTVLLQPFPLHHVSSARLAPLKLEAGRVKVIEATYAPWPSGELRLKSWRFARSRPGNPVQWK